MQAMSAGVQLLTAN